MAKNRTPPKWWFPIFTTAAVILFAAIVYDLVRGEAISTAHLAGLAISTYFAALGWRKRRKAADSPPEE